MMFDFGIKRAEPFEWSTNRRQAMFWIITFDDDDERVGLVDGKGNRLFNTGQRARGEYWI